MSSVKQLSRSLPYFEDSAKLFATIANQPWAVFLDSGFPYSNQGRFDILASEPVCKIITQGLKTTVIDRDQSMVLYDDPFDILKAKLQDKRPAIAGLPFNGGAIGYFAYDLARRLEKLPDSADDAENIPDMAIGIYEWAVIVDHQKQQSWLVYPEHQENLNWLVERFSSLLTVPLHNTFQVLGDIDSNMTPAYYAHAFERIKHYLKEGDCYQVNLAQRFNAFCKGDLWSAYQVLRKINAAPFSSYINLPDVQVLSSSPERFLKVENSKVETKPIKGTRPRKPSPAEDHAIIKELTGSFKDRAENVMIVDLLRNDISKTCEQGTVKVPKLFDVETFATVHHLVSTVCGKLKKDKHPLDLLRSCFPGGSITGAPKIRAMEIIEELEPNRRGIYCGSVGYCGYDGNMDTNIAIRTLVHSNDSIRFWAGGGIVNDSDPDAEYQESFDKAAAMLDLLKQMS